MRMVRWLRGWFIPALPSGVNPPPPEAGRTPPPPHVAPGIVKAAESVWNPSVGDNRPADPFVEVKE